MWNRSLSGEARTCRERERKRDSLIATMEMSHVGVRTRAQAALAMEPASSAVRTPKRRKININNRNEEPKVKPEPAPATEEHSSDEEFPASCCSSNGSGSVALDEERIKSLDLEVREIEDVFLFPLCLNYVSISELKNLMSFYILLNLRFVALFN